MDTILSPETRSRLAQGASALLAMPQVCAAVDAEVEQTLDEHQTLPRTEAARRVLWGLAFPQVSQSALTHSAKSQKPRRK